MQLISQPQDNCAFWLCQMTTHGQSSALMPFRNQRNQHKETWICNTGWILSQGSSVKRTALRRPVVRESVPVLKKAGGGSLVLKIQWE